jgi:hypothetical protein
VGGDTARVEPQWPLGRPAPETRAHHCSAVARLRELRQGADARQPPDHDTSCALYDLIGAVTDQTRPAGAARDVPQFDAAARGIAPPIPNLNLLELAAGKTVAANYFMKRSGSNHHRNRRAKLTKQGTLRKVSTEDFAGRAWRL